MSLGSYVFCSFFSIRLVFSPSEGLYPRPSSLVHIRYIYYASCARIYFTLYSYCSPMLSMKRNVFVQWILHYLHKYSLIVSLFAALCLVTLLSCTSLFMCSLNPDTYPTFSSPQQCEGLFIDELGKTCHIGYSNMIKCTHVEHSR